MKTSIHQKGQGLVEFALVALTLMIAIIVGIEAIMFIIQWQTLHQVADFGVREAAKDGGATTRVLDELDNQMRLRGVDPDTVQVQIYAVDIGSDGQITPKSPRTQLCKYGEDIAIQLDRPWEGVVFSVTSQAHQFTVVHTFECWRGRIE